MNKWLLALLSFDMFIELSITSFDFDLMNLKAGLTIFYEHQKKDWTKQTEKKFENVEILLKIANFFGKNRTKSGNMTI